MGTIVTDLKVLYQISEHTNEEEIKKLNLKQQIIDVLPSAWIKGYGLAAIQIGVPVRYAYFRFEGKEYELINPKITYRRGISLKQEGCLSLPKQFNQIIRAYAIEYRSNGKTKRAKNRLAQIIQHEIDHMDGILTADYWQKSDQLNGQPIPLELVGILKNYHSKNELSTNETT